MTVKSHTNAGVESHLAFFKSIIQPPFDDDTNANIDHVWIALVYPDIEVRDGKNTLIIDCAKAGLSVPQHSYPLLRFLERFPEACEKIIFSHSYLAQSYQEFLQQSESLL
jgi:hypothetical protein